MGRQDPIRLDAEADRLLDRLLCAISIHPLVYVPRDIRPPGARPVKIYHYRVRPRKHVISPRRKEEGCVVCTCWLDWRVAGGS